MHKQSTSCIKHKVNSFKSHTFNNRNACHHEKKSHKQATSTEHAKAYSHEFGVKKYQPE